MNRKDCFNTRYYAGGYIHSHESYEQGTRRSTSIITAQLPDGSGGILYSNIYGSIQRAKRWIRERKQELAAGLTNP